MAPSKNAKLKMKNEKLKMRLHNIAVRDNNAFIGCASTALRRGVQLCRVLADSEAVETPPGRVAQVKKKAKAAVKQWNQVVKLRNLRRINVLRLVGGPTQPRSGSWAARLQADSCPIWILNGERAGRFSAFFRLFPPFSASWGTFYFYEASGGNRMYRILSPFVGFCRLLGIFFIFSELMEGLDYLELMPGAWRLMTFRLNFSVSMLPT
jgi:hypothetical protein